MIRKSIDQFLDPGGDFVEGDFFAFSVSFDDLHLGEIYVLRDCIVSCE
jgi:hypothetical protein